jgi:hypothetical protein
MTVFRSAPVLFRRAFFILASFAATLGIAAVPKGQSSPPLTSLGKPNRADAQAAIEQVRRQGIVGNYFFEFHLRIMPRRGEERIIPGQLWGTQSGKGALSRVTLMLNGANGPGERRFLIQNGRESAVWRWETGGTVQPLGAASLFEPIVADTELSAFDLQMPFIYWDEFEYEGLERFRGRPAHILIMRPPPAFTTKYPTLTGVRVHLDTQFNALVQTELLGAKDAVSKTVSLVNLKMIDEQPIPKTFDVRDEKTRNKTRFDVTAVALGLEFSRVLFEPAHLAEEVRAPAESQMTRIDPKAR